MRYLVLSDMHGNLHALDAVLEDAREVGFDETLVLGDLVGYGADPGEVLDRTLALSPRAMIRGNHDKVCAGLEPATLFNDIARQAVEWTARVLSTEQMAVLKALPRGPQMVTDELQICHGAPFDEDYYVFDTHDAGRALEASTGQVCLFGHTHLPAVFTAGGESARRRSDLADDELALPPRGRALINVGSVGQPRDGDPRAAYGLLDTSRQTIRLRRVVYNIAGAQGRIIEAGLPPWLAHRLSQGR